MTGQQCRTGGCRVARSRQSLHFIFGATWGGLPSAMQVVRLAHRVYKRHVNSRHLPARMVTVSHNNGPPFQ